MRTYNRNSPRLPSRKLLEESYGKKLLYVRNLTPDQRSIMRGRRYNRTKKSMADAGAMKGKACAEVAQAPVNTAETIAKQHGVSSRTVIRDGKRAEAIEKLAETHRSNCASTAGHRGPLAAPCGGRPLWGLKESCQQKGCRG